MKTASWVFAALTRVCDWVTYGSRNASTAPSTSKTAAEEGYEQVQDKRVNVWAEFGDYKGHLMSHQTADEMNIAR